MRRPTWVPDCSSLIFEYSYANIGSEFFCADNDPSDHGMDDLPSKIVGYQGINGEILVLQGKITGKIQKIVKVLDYLPTPQESRHLYAA
jgi:hypothetical protein